MALITRQVRNSIFIHMLNGHDFRYLFRIMPTEYVTEFEIINNTLTVKLIDKRKEQQLKRGKLQKTKPTSLTSLTRAKFLLGRMNSIRLSDVLQVLNKSLLFKSTLGFPKNAEINNLRLAGVTIIATGLIPDPIAK